MSKEIFTQSQKQDFSTREHTGARQAELTISGVPKVTCV
jgi:hypothetical protein